MCVILQELLNKQKNVIFINVILIFEQLVRKKLDVYYYTRIMIIWFKYILEQICLEYKKKFTSLSDVITLSNWRDKSKPAKTL